MTFIRHNLTLRLRQLLRAASQCSSTEANQFKTFFERQSRIKYVYKD